MVEKNFGSLQQFAKLYQFIGKQPRNRDEVSDFVMTGMSMKSKNTVRNYTEKVFEGELPFLVVDGDVVSIDGKAYWEFIKMTCDYMSIDMASLIPTPPTKKKKPEDDIAKITTVDSPRVVELKNKIAELQVELSQEKKRHKEEFEKYDAERKMALDNLQKQLDQLKKRRAKKACASILDEMDKKVVITASIHSVPAEPLATDYFLDDSHWQIDVPYMVSKYGGEKDSLYKVIDAKEKNLEVKPYVSSVFRRLMSCPIFKKRVEDESHMIVEEEGTISEEKARYLERRKITGEEIYKNRLISINRMLDNPNLSNQMKLAYYAAMTETSGREMHDLLNYAGDNCVDAVEVIRLLENPMEFNNYHNVRGFLRQAVKPSEARIKRETVRELICGEWYVEAEYNGKPCKFQMLPVSELEAFKKALMESQFAEALLRLQKLITTERKAEFKNDNVDDVLVVTDCKQKPVEDKLQDELPPGQKLMRQMEAKSGVDVHVVIDEDSYDDGFEEATADERKE